MSLTSPSLVGFVSREFRIPQAGLLIAAKPVIGCPALTLASSLPQMPLSSSLLRAVYLRLSMMRAQYGSVECLCRNAAVVLC